MKVYHKGAKSKFQKDFVMCIAPAADVKNMEIPQDWLDEKGNPRQFNITFEFGEAEVEDDIGRYLISKGYVAKSSLILPTSVNSDNYLDVLNQGG